MAELDYVYVDDDLTTLFDDSDPLAIGAILSSSGTGYLLVGDPAVGQVLEAASDPGVDPITLSIVDASPGGGVEASHIKLALTEGGLASAIGGDPVNLGASIDSEAANAVKVWVQWDNSTGGSASTEISLSLVAINKRAA